MMEGFTVIGRLASPKGTSGHLKGMLETDKKGFETIEAFFIEDKNGLPLPYFIEKIEWEGETALIKLEEVDSKEQAFELAGKEIYLPEAELDTVPIESPLQYGYLEGYMLLDRNLGSIGLIEEVLEMPGQEVAVVDNDGNEVLVPLNNDLMVRIDKEKREVEMDLPEGLLDIYQNED